MLWPAAAAPCANDGVRTGLSARLPDCRAYEMVSPGDKNSVDVFAGGYTRAASSGDAVTFAALGAFAGAPASSVNQYLARRGSAGWTTASINAPLTVSNRVFPVEDLMEAFTSDLSRAVLRHYAPPSLAPGDTEGFRNFYIRDDATGSYTTVTNRGFEENVPGSGQGEIANFGAASADLDHVALSTPNGGTLVPGAPQEAAYLWSAGQGIELVSIEPGTETPFVSAGVGAGAGPQPGAVSDDGSRVVFSAPASSFFPEPKQVYVRKDAGTPGAETVRASAPAPGVSDPGGTQPAMYRVAGADGDGVFFSSAEKLTAGSTADSTTGSEDLYRFDVFSGELADLTTADPAGAGFQGLVGASRDADTLYFIATGALAAGATAGQPNLYRWRAGAGIDIVATVTPGDVEPLTRSSGQRAAVVTPDGGAIAFSSRAAIDPAFDNVDPQSGEPHWEVYLYTGGAPRCVSCVGAGPATADSTITSQLGDSIISQPRDNPYRGSIAESGSRVFFESGEALVAADTNKQVDVYEYEQGSDGPNLISTGTSASAANFAAASPDGDDVFFVTRQRLTGADRDSLLDVYDARVGGGYAEPPPPPVGCEGEACQGPPPATPASREPVQVSGPGNAKAKRAKPRRRRAGCRKSRSTAKHGRATASAKKRCGKNGQQSRKGR
ncbi:MAG TPA: hypothetical protein VHA54_09620 [Solirubrobacterales bacterium]|nr:hypothetical protein [Solirubrobacterales bacterium]